MNANPLPSQPALWSRFKKLLLPGVFLLTLGYLICLLFFPAPAIRFGFVWGFLLGLFNMSAMIWLIGRLLQSREGRKTAVLAALLVAKVLSLFGLFWLGFKLWQWQLLAMAAGYLSVLFLVVLGLSFGYKPARIDT